MRTRPNDDEGKPIDPSKDLAAFLEKAAPASEPEGAQAPVEPAWKTVTFDDVDDPDIKGKSGADVVGILAKQREEAAAARQRATEVEIELARTKQQREQEATTRRILAEQALPPVQREPEVDPRIAQRDEMWLSGDYQNWHALNDAIQADARKADIAVAVEQTKNDMRNELRTTSAREEATQAYWQAQKYLESQGVPAQAYHERARAMLGEVTWEQSPYFQNGGPRNASNLVGAFYKLFGQPKQEAAPAATATPPTPSPPVQPTPVAPPGSGRPAPAAAAPRQPSVHLSADQKRDADQMANAFGYDPEKFAARRRARIEKERDAHA